MIAASQRGSFIVSVALSMSLAAVCLVLRASAEAEPAAAPSPLAGPETRLLSGVGFEQRLNGQVPLDQPFHDESGGAVMLRDFTPGPPIVLVLADYRCRQLCHEVLQGAFRGLSALPFKEGTDYRVVVIGIRPDETPDLAHDKKRLYERRFGQSPAEGWKFLTGPQASIAATAAAIGFSYQYDEKSDQFAHPSGICLLTAEGRVSRYLFGIDFAPRDLRLALVEASANKIGTPVDQFLLLCFHYDPSTGRYGLAIVRIVRIAAGLTVLALATTIGRFLRRERRERRSALASAAPVSIEGSQGA